MSYTLRNIRLEIIIISIYTQIEAWLIRVRTELIIFDDGTLFHFDIYSWVAVTSHPW